MIVLLIAGVLALQNPKVQTKLAQYYTNSLSKKLDTEVSIGSLDIDFFTQVRIQDFYIEDKKGDTLFYAGNLYSKALNIDFLQGGLLLSDATLKDVSIHISRSETDSLTNLSQLFPNKRNTKTNHKKEKRSFNIRLSDTKIENFQLTIRDSLKNKATDVVLNNLFVDFETFDLDKKTIVAKKLIADQPLISLINTKPPVHSNDDQPIVFSTPEDWQFLVKKLRISNADFISRAQPKDKEKKHAFSFSNFYMKKLNLNANQFLVKENAIHFKLNEISFQDETGFQISKLKAKKGRFSDRDLMLSDMQLTTPQSYIHGDILFKMKSIDDFANFEQNIKIQSKLDEVKLMPKDLTYLFGSSPVNEAVYLKGKLTGTVDHLEAEAFELRLEHGSILQGDINATGLPDLMNTFFDAKIEKLYTTQDGLLKITQKESFPDKLTKFGDITFHGNFLGYLTELVADGSFQTNLGKINADLKFSGRENPPSYSGFLSSSDFRLGYWLDNPSIGSLNVEADLRGKDFDLKTIEADINATIHEVTLKGKAYKDIDVIGKLSDEIFTANIDAKDEHFNGQVDGKLNYSTEFIEINFESDIRQANLYELGILDEQFIASGNFSSTLSGDSLDNLDGQITAENLSIQTVDRTISLKNASISVSENKGTQLIALDTDTIHAEFLGKYKYTQLIPTFLKTIQQYYDFDKGWENLENTVQTNETIQFKLFVDEEDELIEIFVNGLEIESDVEFDGLINPVTKEVSLVANTDRVKYKQYAISDWQLDAIGTGDILVVNSFQDKIYNNGKKWLVNSEINLEFDGKEVLSEIRTMNEEFLAAKLTTKLRKDNGLYKFSILQSDLIINEKRWTIQEDNSITFGNGKWIAKNFILKNGEQKIEIYNPYGNTNTKLIAIFDAITLEGVNELIGFTNKPFGGNFSGKVRLVDHGGQLKLDTSIDFSNFMYNNDTIETLSIDGLFNIDQKQGDFEGIIQDNDYSGGLEASLDLTKPQDILDINVYFDRTSLSPFGNLFSTTIENLEGYAKGNIHVIGGPTQFNMDGSISVIEDLVFTVKFTKARYTVPKGQTVTFVKDRFSVSNLKLLDAFGNEATLNGGILHNSLANFRVDIIGRYQDFMFLNTTRKDNEVFYGTAYAAGSMSFTGPIEDIVLDIFAESKPGTNIHIANADTKNTSEYTFVRFRKPITDTLEVKEPTNSKLTMHFDLDINPSANLFMSFDSEDYNTLKGNGNGNLKINFDTQDLFEMFGIYKINQGQYVVNFEEVLKKDFELLPGGLIQWSGDPFGARLNLNAKEQIKADVSALSQTNLNQQTEKIDTDIIVNLSDTIREPQFKYKIEVNGSSVTPILSEQIKLINRNKALLDKQLIMLLTSNQFIGNESDPFETDQTIGDVAFNSVTSILTRQLTSLLSEIDGLKNTEIGLAYQNYRNNLDENQLLNAGLDQQIQFELSQKIAKNVRLKVGSDINFGDRLNTTDTGNRYFNVKDVIMDIDINEDGKYDISFFSKFNYNVFQKDNLRRNGVSYIIEKEFTGFKTLFKKKKEKAIREKQLKIQNEEIDKNKLKTIDEDSNLQ